MKFNSEKELAILLVSMVLFMVIQTVCTLHVDKRVDRLSSKQEKMQEEVDELYKREQSAAYNQQEFVEVVGNGLTTEVDDTVKVVDTSDGIGYDFELMCRVITAEGGTDREVCMGVAQALYNACEKHEWRYSPTEVMSMYRYTEPLDWVSDEALDACVNVFLHDNTYVAVGNATLFYAPQYCNSEWHEQQRFVCEIHGVRFFEENG